MYLFFRSFNYPPWDEENRFIEIINYLPWDEENVNLDEANYRKIQGQAESGYQNKMESATCKKEIKNLKNFRNEICNNRIRKLQRVNSGT